MAALPNFQVKENEFYEIHHDDIPPNIHPQPELIRFKIMMVFQIMKVSERSRKHVCKWPSMNSLMRFFKYRDSVMPDFDKECMLTEHEVSLLLLRHIDPVQLFFYYERSPLNWLDNRGVEILNAAMDSGVRVESRIRPNRFYEIDRNALPQMLRDDFGIARIAFVDVVTVDRNDPHPTVKMAIPSTESLDAFQSSPGLLLPRLDGVFTISRASASLFLKWNLPTELFFPHRMRREMWFVE